MAEVLADADAAGLVDWKVSADSSIVRAHQHGTNTTRPAGPSSCTGRQDVNQDLTQDRQDAGAI